MSNRKMVNLDFYAAKRMQDKINEADKERVKNGRRPLKICEFMEIAINHVPIALLVKK